MREIAQMSAVKRKMMFNEIENVMRSFEISDNEIVDFWNCNTLGMITRYKEKRRYSMTTIEEVIEDVGFVEWSSSEQQALNKLMKETAEGHSTDHITSRTDRVMTTFLRILNTHLPGKGV